MEITAEILRNKSQLDLLKDDWNELLNDSDADTIFLTWQWIESWIEVQDENPDFYVITIRDEKDRLIAIAPFYRTTYRILDRIDVAVFRVLGDSMPGAEYGNIIVRHGHLEKVAVLLGSKLKAMHKDWDIIWMPNFAKWTESYLMIKTRRRPHHRCEPG